MPRLTRDEIDRQRARLLRIIGGFPEGIGREKLAREYETRFGTRIAWRTLLRRLRDLADAGKITAVGVARNRVYRPAPVRAPAQPGAGDGGASGDPATEEDYVPVSPAGAQVRALVRRPVSQREPVGYRMEFLERYRPGTTWYLPEDLRRHLHEIGTTPDPERPAGTFARDVFDRLLIDLSWASSRLEGNTYSRLDTQNLIQFGQQAEGKDGQQAQMILNHKRAIGSWWTRPRWWGWTGAR